MMESARLVLEATSQRRSESKSKSPKSHELLNPLALAPWRILALLSVEKPLASAI